MKIYRVKFILFVLIVSLFSAGFSISQTNNILTLDNISKYKNHSQFFDFKNISPSTQINNLWRMIQTPSFPYYTTDVFFIDSLFGWACHSGFGIGIMKTTNSGYSWDSIQFSSSGDFLSEIIFVDRLTGWTCGSNGAIRKTTNGGNNWYSQDIFVANYYTIYFNNSNTGFVGGYNATDQALLIKSTNSGNNWQRVLEDTINQHTEIYCQHWIDSITGWFGGRQFFVKTTNGGASFTNMFPEFSNNYSLNTIFFFDENTGWVGGNNGAGKNIYKTTNGGLNWTYQFNPVSQYSFPQINDIKFISKDTGWASALIGFILKTTNGGSNWNIDLDTNVEFSKFHTFEKSKIWCGASYGQIWYLDIDKTTGVTNDVSTVEEFYLYQNYPNPFNPTTTIKYHLSKDSKVYLKIFSAAGKEVSTVVDKEQKKGFYLTHFDGRYLPSGIYYYELTTNEFKECKKMILLK